MESGRERDRKSGRPPPADPAMAPACTSALTLLLYVLWLY